MAMTFASTRIAVWRGLPHYVGDNYHFRPMSNAKSLARLLFGRVRTRYPILKEARIGMAMKKVHYEPDMELLTVFWDAPRPDQVCTELDDGVVLIKSASGLAHRH